MGGIRLSGISQSDDTKPGNNINFLLYCNPSRKNTFTELTENNIESIQLSNFDSEKKTKVLIHGFNSQVFYEFPRIIKATYLERNKDDYNIICVNWAKLSGNGLDYKIAPSNLAAAAKGVTDFLIWLVENTNLRPFDVHLVGHCIGAHLCGMVGKRMGGKRMTLGRISALNPAGCGFETNRAIRMVEKNDAYFVDVYRTSCKSLTALDTAKQSSTDWPGHMYFAIQGAWTQRTCNKHKGTCNHEAYRIFARTILEGSENFHGNSLLLQGAGHETASSNNSRRVALGEYCLPGIEGCYHIRYHGDGKKPCFLLTKQHSVDSDDSARLPVSDLPAAIVTIPSSETDTDDLDPDIKNEVNFVLYSNPNNKYEGTELILNDIESLKQSNFDSKKKTKILFHGMTSHVFSEFPRNIKDAYLENKHKNDLNVICVNWGQLSGTTTFNYMAVAQLLDLVAIRVSDLLIWLAETMELDLCGVHLVGYSLGAEICGHVGRTVKAKAEGKALGRISALDPPGRIGFGTDDRRVLLKETDAQFVDVYRTSSLSPATKSLQGHMDFIINGGSQQPNCKEDFLGIESHAEAPKFYAKTILDGPEKTFLTSKAFQPKPGNGSASFITDRRIIVGEYCIPGPRAQYNHYTHDYK